MKTGTLYCDECGFQEAFISNNMKWGEVGNCPRCDGPAEYTTGDRVGMVTDEFGGEGVHLSSTGKTYTTRSEMKQDLDTRGLRPKDFGEDRDARATQYANKLDRRKKIEHMVEKNINKPWQRNVADPTSRSHKPAGYKGDPKTVELEPGYKYGVGNEKHG